MYINGGFRLVIGVPPVLIHLQIGIFREKTFQFGYPHDYGNA